MTQGYQVRNQSGLHYLTFQIVQWADLFTRQVYRDIVHEQISLRSFHALQLQYAEDEKGCSIT